jgi:transcriptional regulator with PAS, ATPase and Fis domain
MARTCFALVANDSGFRKGVQTGLARHLTDAPSLATAEETLLDQLGPDVQGLVLFAAAGLADEEWIARRVQDLTLRQWPTSLVVLESEEFAQRSQLAVLDPYLIGRFVWPQSASALAKLIKQHLPAVAAPAEAEPSLPARIERRLVAQTPSLGPMAEAVAVAAANDVNVLLTGETGTGKTYLARLIHDFSSRRRERLLAVPCGALSANLIGSELFGHVKGAYTGADRDKAGKFEAVGHGTLLLDEIDALPLEQQASLLRVLETGDFEPVGSIHTRHCHARVIAASNLDLEAAVRAGRFRQDLYYRLNVVALHLPPLRERVQDIAPLARDLAARYNAKFRKGLFTIQPDALAALEGFSWPGNVRQLENVVQQAVLLSTGPALLRSDLPAVVVRESAAATARPAAARSLLDTREGTESALIQQALVQNNYSRTKAAAALGVSRVTLYLKMKKYGLMERPIYPPWSEGPGKASGGKVSAP